MTQAISPQEAVLKHKQQVPSEVIEVWNQLIVTHLQVRKTNIESKFLLEELSKKLQQKMNLNFEQLRDKGYLDLEYIFENQGWKVVFDKPAYCESYAANFTFSQKKS
jgi:hypothetical protein